MAIINEFQFGHAHVIVRDDCYIDRSPEDIERDKKRQAQIATKIWLRAALREQSKEEARDEKKPGTTAAQENGVRRAKQKELT